MQIASLSTLKKRKITMPKSLLESLEMYSRYLSEKNGQKYRIDDIIASVALASKPKLNKEVPADIKVKIPEAAWDSLQRLGHGSIESGCTELYKQLEGLAKDSEFKAWKENNTH